MVTWVLFLPRNCIVLSKAMNMTAGRSQLWMLINSINHTVRRISWTFCPELILSCMDYMKVLHTVWMLWHYACHKRELRHIWNSIRTTLLFDLTDVTTFNSQVTNIIKARTYFWVCITTKILAHPSRTSSDIRLGTAISLRKLQNRIATNAWPS